MILLGSYCKHFSFLYQLATQYNAFSGWLVFMKTENKLLLKQAPKNIFSKKVKSVV